MLSASISVAMNNTALGLALAITLLLCHMYLETKTTELVDSLEVASIKFLNTVIERRAQAPRPVAAAAAPPPPLLPARVRLRGRPRPRRGRPRAHESSSALVRRQQRNHSRYRGRNDLNIVPMLDVMVILTFFLIFTAVFSKTSVLEVNLPGPGRRPPPSNRASNSS